MAICLGSSFGTIKGSVGNITFSYIRGKQIVYLKRDYTLFPKEQSIGFKNMSALLALTMRIYHLLRPGFRKYWKNRNYRMLEHNSFIRQNIGFLYDSIPNKNLPLSESNWVNLSAMNPIYEGKLFEPKNTPQNLIYEGNRLSLKWDSRIHKNGTSEDIAHILVFYCKPSDRDMKVFDTFFYSNEVHKYSENAFFTKQQNSILSDGDYELKVFYGRSLRHRGETSIFIDESLNPKFLSVFLFFSNDTTYSLSCDSSALIPTT
ncbi:MAG: hypothetical protein PHX21_09395 [bacterium]|nr:hypothetical protein [bacterium]